jgi:hypothetical protein
MKTNIFKIVLLWLVSFSKKAQKKSRKRLKKIQSHLSHERKGMELLLIITAKGLMEGNFNMYLLIMEELN